MKRTKHEVAQIVREYLKGSYPGGVTLEVVEQDIQKGDSWWRVPLRPSAWPVKMFEYYEALAEIEIALQEKEGLNILFATGEPLEAQAA